MENNNLHYRIVLDMFSGQQNPFVVIPQKDFVLLFNELNFFENEKEEFFFDGLGFRGINIYSGNTNIVIQQNIVKIETNQSTEFLKSSKNFYFKTLVLFDKFDLSHKYDIFKNSNYSEILGI